MHAMSPTPRPRRPASAVDLWFPYRRPRSHPRLRLFCFPYAGGSAAAFRTWPDGLPAGVEVCAAQPPGRERRLSEPAFTRVAPLIDALAEVIRPLLDLPFVLLGHSLGGRVAYELARRLREVGGPQPLHLIATGCRALHMPSPDPPIHALPEDEFIQELRRLGGTPHEVLENAELMQLMLPLLRADFELVETYTFEPGKPLDCPISAIGGREDAEVPREAVEGWGELTRGPFRACILEGDHFFLHDHRRELLQEVRHDLVGHLAE